MDFPSSLCLAELEEERWIDLDEYTKRRYVEWKVMIDHTHAYLTL